MKKFSDYTTPKEPAEEPKKLSLAEQAWIKAKQKSNKKINLEEEILEQFQEEEYVAPIVEEYIPEPQIIVEQVQGIQGPQGIQGLKGDKGEQGIPGRDGLPGPIGQNGIAGAKGDTGDRGEKGDKGDKGDRGDIGPRGERGDDGFKGDRGDKGDTGEQGIQGPQGERGDKGDAGAQGPKGDKGDVGPEGKTGQKGAAGPKGDRGDQGERGDKGDKGDVGEQGPIGPVGPKGDKGADGKTPDLKKFAEKFDKLSQDINKRIDKTITGINLTSGGGSGSYWLNDLGDTDYQGVKNATDGQVLTFDETLGKWTAADATGGGGGTVDNVARIRANNAWNQANTGTLLAQAAYDYANTISLTPGPTGPQGNTGNTGPTGPKGDKGDTGSQGPVGPNYNNAFDQANLAFNRANTANLLAQAAYDYANTLPTSLTTDRLVSGSNSAIMYANGTIIVPNDIIPVSNGIASLGTITNRWADVWIGPNTFNIIDQVTGNNASLTVQDGTLLIDNTLRIQIGDMALTTNGISLVATATSENIAVGALYDTGYLELRNVGLKFRDGTIQTTAATNIDSWARNTVNTAYNFANTVNVTAQSAYNKANAAYNYANNMTLDSLTDATVSGPSDGQILTYNSTLGQWINQAPTITSNNFTTGYYGSFLFGGANVTMSSTTTQYVIPVNATFDGTNGIVLGGNNDIVFANAGTYKVEYSIQYVNDGNVDDDVDVWVRVNGINLANTNSLFTVVRKNTGAAPGNMIAIAPYILTLNAGDKVQMMTTSSFGQTKIVTYAPHAPDVPGAPGVIVNAEQIAGIIIPYNISGTSNNSNYLGNVIASAYATTANAQANVGSGLITVTSAYQANVGSGLITTTSAYQANVGAGLIAEVSARQANVGSAITQAQANSGAGLITEVASRQANVGSGLITAKSTWEANTGAGLLTKLDLTGGSLSSRLNVTYTPASTTGTALQLTAANTIGGTGYADVLKMTNTSGGATLPNKTIRINNLGSIEIIDSNYGNNIFNLSDSGDLTIKGNLITANRPAFRVYGGGTTSITATNTLTNSNFVVDFNQGSYLNTTTGIFTAPISGLYQVNLIARFSGSASIAAIQVQKTSGVTTSTQVYIEWAGNSTAYHMGGSSVTKLAAGDTLKCIVTSGTVTFDANDSWSVAYLG